ncbi:non-homologous end-joining DNA ligase [Leifsonia kafniensis]
MAREEVMLTVPGRIAGAAGTAGRAGAEAAAEAAASAGDGEAREAGAAREVRLSSPSRVLWPEAGFTKLDLAQYIVAVGAAFVAANGDRPISLQRFAGNIDGEQFFSKNPPKGTPDFVRSVMVTYPSGRTHPQLVIDEPAAAVWAVQMNTIVFHPWPSRAEDSDHPDELRIDLDPQPGTDFDDAIPVAFEMRSVLAEAGLTTFIKTSGNRGLHLACPIEPTHEFLDVRHAVIAAARELERRMPDQVSTSWWKELRGTRIFVDFNQANRDRTMAGAYSPRAVAQATVSCPIGWDELENVNPRDFTIATVPDRLVKLGDPWAKLHAHPGSIGDLLLWWERDVQDGLGELPFPPDFPKMPGEPPRVQPSRARSGS